MRMSCNGCRVLRKGCSADCTIRPCLQWIKSPDSQANATLFLAKFYGRAGLINLIEAGPPHLRPAIFRSLLYEACGRIVNPVYGSVGLIWAGNWAQCQAAVEAVFKGTPIPEIAASSSASASDHQQPPSAQMLASLKAFDVRHVSKDPTSADRGLDKARGKRPVSRPNSTMMGEMGFGPMNESWMNQVMGNGIGFGEEDGSLFSLETVEGSLTGQAGANPVCKDDEAGLDLTLGLI